jgi:hypothetical protein
MFDIGDKILAYIGGAVSAALAVALLVTWLVDHARISDLTTQRDKAQKALSTEQENSSALKGGLATLSANIASWKAEGDKATATANAALAAAQAANNKLLKSAADILKAKPTGDLCKSADTLILGNIQ